MDRDKHPRNFRLCLLATLLAGFASTASAGDPSKRESFISGLVSQWSSSVPGGASAVWAERFAAELRKASPQKLLAIQNAASFDAMRAILGGESVLTSTSGLAGTAALGDYTSDLTYTPATPCRVLDTRADGDGNTPVPSGSTRDYYVWGPAAQLAPQGHTAGTGCPSPKGWPAAIAANFAVVPTTTGHIRVFPYLAPMPNASFINYQAGNNLANAGIITACYGCAKDISIYNASTTNYLADVMGYFYPVDKYNDISPQFGGSAASPFSSPPLTGSCFSDPTHFVVVEATGPGFITVNAQVWVRTLHTAGNDSYARTHISENLDDCPTENFDGGYHSMQWSLPGSLPTGTYDNELHVSRTYYVATPGIQQYWLTGLGTEDSSIYGASMQAIFHRQ